MIEVLFEDNHCLALYKPAGWLTQGDATGDLSLLDWAKLDLKARFAKPGNVFVGLLHRLDRPVSGVVLFAKTSKAAARLSDQFRRGDVEKVYQAVIEGRPGEPRGEWRDWLLKDERLNLVSAVERGTTGAKEAVVSFAILDSKPNKTALELRPKTGRSHQLRVQLASRGLPIVGDVKYGAKTRWHAEVGGGRLALHASSLTFQHPIRGERISVLARLPRDWPWS